MPSPRPWKMMRYFRSTVQNYITPQVDHSYGWCATNRSNNRSVPSYRDTSLIRNNLTHRITIGP